MQAELGASKDAVIALQSEVADLTKTLNAQAEVAKKSKAEAFVDQALSDTLAGKVAAGVLPEHIIAKELSLGGVQRPLDPALLGENAVQWFRFGEFAGWIITS